MSKIKPFIESLKASEIEVYHESCSNRVLVTFIGEEYRLEFYVNYEVEVKNYVSATWTNPEEYDLVFHNEDHDEIALYKGEEDIELTEDELKEIDEIISTKIY